MKKISKDCGKCPNCTSPNCPVGAVTHVFVNDPTRGYGIFIENMLAEAEKIR